MSEEGHLELSRVPGCCTGSGLWGVEVGAEAQAGQARAIGERWRWPGSGSLCVCLLFRPCCASCRILAPRPGMEPVPLAGEVRSLNHWTAREGPVGLFRS